MSNTTQTPPAQQEFNKTLPTPPAQQDFLAWLSQQQQGGDYTGDWNPYAIGYKAAKDRYDAEQLDPEKEKKRLKIIRNLSGMVDTVGLLGDIVNASLGGNVKARTESATSEAGKKLEKERLERQARLKELYGDLTKERAQALAGAHQLYTDEINKAYKDYGIQLGEYKQQRAEYDADRQYTLNRQEAIIRQQNANTAQVRADAYKIAQQNRQTADERAKSRANSAVVDYWKGAYTFNLGEDYAGTDVSLRVTPSQYASINSTIVHAIGTGANPSSGTIADAYNALSKLAESRGSGVTSDRISDIVQAYKTLQTYTRMVANKKNETLTVTEIQNMIGAVVGLRNALTSYQAPDMARPHVESMINRIGNIYDSLLAANTESAKGADEVYDRVYVNNASTPNTQRQSIEDVLSSEDWGSEQ